MEVSPAMAYYLARVNACKEPFISFMPPFLLTVIYSKAEL